MPREAVQLNAAQRVLPLSEIAPTLLRLTGRRAGGAP
jgi:chemotaxis response regulator CheB